MNGALLRALLKLNEHAIPIGLVANALWWAFVMFHPFAVFAYSPSYAGMAEMMNEEQWGAVFATVAALQLGGLLSGVYKVRVFSASIATLLWITIGSTMIISNWLSTGTGNYLIWGGLSALSTILVFYEKAR